MDDLASGNLLHSELENGPVEIVDFPVKNKVIFHSYVSLPEGTKNIWNTSIFELGKSTISTWPFSIANC